MRVRVSRRTSVPLERIWEVLQDHEGMSTWSPAVSVSVERPGLLGLNGVGTVRRVGGPGVVIREEITEYDPLRRLSYRAVSGIPFRNYTGEVLLGATGSTTGVTWILACDNTFPPIRFALRMFAWMFLGALLRAAQRNQSVS